MRSLAVDDEFVALSKMVALLGPLGSCDAATNGQQASSMLCKALDESKPYNLITIDINMPDTNGIALLMCLQKEEKKRHVPQSTKLIVTAMSTQSNVLAAAKQECDGFLVKPVRKPVLIEKLTALGLLPAEPANMGGAHPTVMATDAVRGASPGPG